MKINAGPSDLDKKIHLNPKRNLGIYYESIAHFPELKICIILYSLYFFLALISSKHFRFYINGE
jgi:hypothetical protein